MLYGKKQISVAQAESLVRGKSNYYKALVALGFFLPSLKSTICTLEWLKEVRRGSCYCPRVEELKFRPCLNPPSVEELRKIIVDWIKANENFDSEEERNAFDRLAEHIERHSPDLKWCLGMVATMDPKHEIF